MSRTVTPVGRVIRDFLRLGLTNREVASKVVRHFMTTYFDPAQLVQRVANVRYRARKAVRKTTKGRKHG
jgi:hypothetical protein